MDDNKIIVNILLVLFTGLGLLAWLFGVIETELFQKIFGILVTVITGKLTYEVIQLGKGKKKKK